MRNGSVTAGKESVEAMQPQFRDYAEAVIRNCKVMADKLQAGGLRIVSGGSDNHLLLVDVKGSIGISGKKAEALLDEAGITCNKNTIPNDPRSPRVTSGVRLGTPAVTTRGMKEADMDVIAGAIAMVIRDEGYVAQARRMVESLTKKYPLP